MKRDRGGSSDGLDGKIQHRINELEQEKIILRQLTEYLESEKVSFDRFADAVSDMALNPVVPIMAYVDLLLAGHFGDLNETQKEKLKLVKASAVLLKDRLSKVQDLEK